MKSVFDSTIRFGGVLSILTGAAYFAVAVSAALLPAELSADPDITPHEFWIVLSNTPGAHMAMHYSFVAVGLLGIGVVLPLARLLKDCSPGLLDYASVLAFLGFAVNARSHLMEAAFDRKVLADYVSAEPAYQEAVHVTAALALDIPDGVLTLGGIGVWMMVITILLSKTDRLSKSGLVIGLAAAVFLVVGVFGYAFMVQGLIVTSFVGGFLVFAPLWHVIIGRTMLRS